VQTFLPYPSFSESARVLDDPRLGKQRVECYQVIRTLDGVTQGWRHHPVVKMWRGHETSLLEYSSVVCEEWIRRGYVDTVLEKLQVHARPDPPVPPPWMGDERIHASHRSNLLRKDPEFYGKLGWTDPPDLPYFWPV
jgi:hypothetical protein